MENKTLSCLYSKIFRNCASPYAILVYIIYILIPTSNHNRRWCYFWNFALYIFWFLHQTTTYRWIWYIITGCISFDSYIKPQHESNQLRNLPVVYLLIPTSNHNSYHWLCDIWLLYIFWFLHQTTTFNSWYAELDVLYIFWFLHQTTTFDSPALARECCISFDSYIKPQPFVYSVSCCCSCISFDSYIKPQLPASGREFRTVVYLLIPTSNHNIASSSSSNIVLYIFWFLHQTTTCLVNGVFRMQLYIFWFLHQTTTCSPS